MFLVGRTLWTPIVWKERGPEAQIYPDHGKVLTICSGLREARGQD